jgi:hypothetical protein
LTQLSGEKRRHFRHYLELRLRRAEGKQLQNLIGKLFGRIHGDNFVPQCPWGDKGDLTCDGYLRSPKTIYACYGRENGTGGRRPTDIVRKVRSDYKGAAAKWPGLAVWVFVSNIVDGVPAPVTALLEKLNGADGIEVGYFGYDSFERHLLGMDAEIVEDLIGEIPVRDDYINLQPPAVLEAVDRIVHAFSLEYLTDPTIVVPENKLQLNQIPPCHAQRIREGSLARTTVAACVAQNTNPLLDANLSDAFRARYQELRAQRLPPDEIMDRLYEFALAGHDGRKAERQATAWALLAYLFDKCSIFEDKPWRDVA